MNMKTVSDVILEYLKGIGVEYIFGVPGSHFNPFFESIANNSSNGSIKLIFSTHENGAAFMADGYARTTKKIGVCCATTGPGITNILTGISCSYAEQIPILLITPQTPVNKHGMGSFQDSSHDAHVKVMKMLEGCTKYSSIITHVNQFEYKLTYALNTAMTQPYGPVHLSIPTEIFQTECNLKLSVDSCLKNIKKTKKTTDFFGVSHAADLFIKNVKNNVKVVFYIGDFANNTGALIEELTELLNADIISSPTGKKYINCRNPRYKGVFGFGGHTSSRESLKHAETVVLINPSFYANATCFMDELLINSNSIHFDFNNLHFGKTPEAKLQISGDTNLNLSELITILKSKLNKVKEINVNNKTDSLAGFSFIPKVKNSKLGFGSVKPADLIWQIIEKFPTDTNYYVDSTSAAIWSIHYLMPKASEKFNISINFASMGWGIGAAIGASFADRKNHTVCFTGDGSFLMSGNELSVAVKYNLPLVIIILKDNLYGMIKQSKQQTSGLSGIDFSIPDCDFCKMAESFGAFGIKIKNINELIALNITSFSKPALIEVQIDKDEILPLKFP